MRKEQVIKFRKQVDSAIIGYLNMVGRKELLAASIELNESLNCLEPAVRRSILAIQDTLYGSLMVEIHAWLFDQSDNSSNLSLYSLLEKCIDIKTNLKHLKNDHITPPETVDLGGSNTSWHQDFIVERGIKFEACFADCKQQIEVLLASGETERVISLRDKVLAHKDGNYDVKSNEHTVGDVFYLLENMKPILLSLGCLLLRTSYPVSESEEQAKMTAKTFWKHVARA